VRKALRQHHGFPDRGPWGVAAVWSKDRPAPPRTCASAAATDPAPGRLRIDCATGFGTAAFVTGAFGLAAAACTVEALLGLPTPEGD
jgi:tRNA A37 threonylcarbamoyladenosine dehydratase